MLWRTMRSGVSLAGAAALFAAIGACSSLDRPPAAGDCLPSEGGKCSPTVIGGGGGSSGGSEASTDTCTVNTGDSKCDQCASTSCCPDLEKCANLPACQNLDSCEEDCNGVGSCVTACQQQFPTGVATLQTLTACITEECLICNESGVGDPCGAIYPPCVAGLSCNGSWCTKACARSTDCAGLGAGGVTSLGTANVCMATATGNVCTPSCEPGGICSDFASTYCLATTAADGSKVSVCSFLPEASTTD
jgi:hypothetical protein